MKKFQSPSLRGSGRFHPARHAAPGAGRRFNPLHCGAVVASVPERDLVNALRKVSIPFIAGQWSLPIIGGTLKPDAPPVSIPFIAGQWSLPGNGAVGERAQITFQSPSLRGSGRFEAARAEIQRKLDVSIPFIAGQWSLLGGCPEGLE